MAVVEAKPTVRAIMILRMVGIYKVLQTLVKDKGGRRRGKGNHSSSSNSQAALNTSLGGLIDCHKPEINAILCSFYGTIVTIEEDIRWRWHLGV